MVTELFLWLIWLPLLASPLIYLVGRLWPQRAWSRWLALLALLAAWLPLIGSWQTWQRQGTVAYRLGQVTLRFDGASLLITAVVLTLATASTLFARPLLVDAPGAEKYDAMVVAMSGTMIGLGCAADLFNLWLWFEAMAITSYLLVAFHRERPSALEAGVKYLLQSVSGSVLVLFGVALVLANAGTVDMTDIQAVIAADSVAKPPLLAAGALFIIGFGVKIALVPLHTWLPDAHSQAPSGISALLSGIVIEVGMLALLRALLLLTGSADSWGLLLIGFGALNMLVGNLLALPQQQLKRLLAFSSVSHVGVMLFGMGIALYAGETAAASGAFFHLVTHSLMKGLAFLAAGAFLYGLHTTPGAERPLTINELTGAAWDYPVAATAFAVALLSLGGLPPLAGFFSKWQILAAGMATQQGLIMLLVAFAAGNSLLSLLYYLPLARTLFQPQPALLVQAGRRPLPLAMTLPLALMAMALILIGLWPQLISGLTEAAGSALLSALP